MKSLGKVNWFALGSLVLVIAAILTAVFTDKGSLVLAYGLGSVTFVLLSERADG